MMALRRRRITRLLLTAALAVGGLAALPAQQAAAADTGIPNGDVIANLWEWNWKSVAAECTDVLDPAGYGAVQVAPPAESLKQSNFYWWDVYQPYAYNLNSRFGTATQFKTMVDTCHAAGIKVYTDAVINHTAAQTGTGYNGTVLTTKYDTPDYDPADSDDCTTTITDWTNRYQVQHCELLGLPDLDTAESGVRTKIIGFLNQQIDLGVDGFRVDAAKHIEAADMSAIVAGLHTTTAGSAPYITQEIYPGTPPSLDEYYGTGDVLDFTFASQVKSQFQGDIANLSSFGSSWGLATEANSNTFVTNHDTERNGYSLSYKDGSTAVLANVFQLARGYGTPSVYAGWTFSQSDEAPPNSGGFVTDTNCASGWSCLDRDTTVSGMVGWHNAATGYSVANWQSPASNVIGFGRGGAGFVAINNSSGANTYAYTTGLADGSYPNVIDGGATTVTVSGGKATLTVPAKGAVAFYDPDYICTVNCGGGTDPGTGTVTATFNEYASTTSGTDVYVVGSVSALGSWNTSSAVKLSSSGYPVWKTDVSVPQSSSIEYKFIKKDGSGNVTWESNANRTLTTGTSAVETNSSWNVASANATDVTFGVNATTTSGTNVYVVGSIPSLGSWNTADAIPLSSASYPYWGRLAIVPKSTSFEYKYIKKDASGNVTWESGANRTYSTGSGAGYSVTDTWK
ncbi:carbohydrate-binding module family 20 domain-containing protein [Streptomyces sp. NBC_00620]|uniref:carbohydrate-binding module family 20 domain-containing protein n=1 Tax=Streptomyces sp. NBC_00620 TaxID=2903666 RepID=UPI00225A4E37|nr:carbohydrate-binding module family 20 domain-containing protein [Streptomyces sp. NBC_00620]MCX4975102.1 alpha-amylase family glycosyl hydrolase [Streptomyces sp. NBC_00620]